MRTNPLFSTGLQLDAGDFLKRLAVYASSEPKAAEDAIREGLIQLREDAETIAPTVPMEMGDLRQDVDIDVNISSARSEGALIYKMPYATRMHEEEYQNYTTEGSGAKYVEAKLANGEKYGRIMADAIKEGTGA